jgi:predicted DNA-binding transcriptional regulator AlpA
VGYKGTMKMLPSDSIPTNGRITRTNAEDLRYDEFDLQHLSGEALSRLKAEIGVIVGQAELTREMISAEHARRELNNSAPHAESDRLIDVKEAAVRLGYSTDFIYTHADEFPFTVRHNRSLRFSSLGIDRYIKKRAGQ